MDLAAAKTKVNNYTAADHTQYRATQSGIRTTNDDNMEAILKLLKDIESRVTALEG